MGISASYISQGGMHRTFDLDGVPETGSMAAETLGAHASKIQLPAMGSMPMHAPAAMLDVPSMSDTKDLENMVTPGGSLVVNGNKLRLRGEENLGGGTKVYGAVGGVSGFWSFDAIDPGTGGDILNGQKDFADGKVANFNGTSGATIRIGGRTMVNVVDGTLVIKNYYRFANITPNGRIRSITNEFDETVCCIALGDLGGGKWCVRPVFDGGKLRSLSFGDSVSLSDDDFKTLDGVTTVDTCTCPNA